MTMQYSGFDVLEMLKFINLNCEYLAIEKVTDFEFKMVIKSSVYGDFEQTGYLFRLVMNAFKPYLDDANLAREKQNKFLDDTLKEATSLGLKLVRKTKCSNHRGI
ncbi:hypothetical protein VVYB158_13205 [Vibrio vulnificus CladeA-yb158]|uniref:hypothetical protein n=2 Tax=Vibrio vulnificus TaxID=672 RepID=UPI00063DCBF7|nr:hypothetical protein [Vibrio vulnificus]KLI66553.1 hypothetical protein VVYB158_13205 [Vibrio vulnificus CladeA-yb158]